ncbi:TPA: IS3 family transposase [Salmonella enterica subsp. enterica serovar Typhi str. AG3]|nr:IS3 family transposase [Salmonella enterica subsp. enterica serovar Typhi str. AG3]
MKHPYVKAVSEKAITYTDEFKAMAIKEYEEGKFARQIFEDAGFDIEIVGIQRAKSSLKRWRAAYQKNGLEGLEDSRKYYSGRPLERELSIEEKYARLEAQNALLRAENELLKKIDLAGKDVGEEKEKLTAEQKFRLIQLVIKKHNLKRMVSYLCELVGVSRSGYYRYFSEEAQLNRQARDEADEEVKEIILRAFNFRRRKKGARQIKMTLENQYQITYNLKRIRRIMKKFQIICPIRKANPYRRMAKATKEHRTLPNLLNREFKQGIARKVLLTDITYLSHGKGKRAYLSTIKDAETNEILAYETSDRLTIDIALNTLKKMKKSGIKLAEGAFIHSDQGFHYTSPQFQKMVKEMGLDQSMSRRGNCWDNAPQESFFGHFKDETDFKSCETLEEVKREIKSYMTYYNYYRGQWNLKKMTPAQYSHHLLQVA